jgi:starch-binding outer membrane protein, SusD/RagB family
MKTISKMKIISAVLTIVLLGACSDDLLDKSNPNQLTKDSFFSTNSQAFAAVTATYAGLQTLNLGIREYFFLHDLLSDDVQTGGAQLEAQRAQVLNHDAIASNGVIGDNWRGHYRTINRANLVIERVPAMTTPVQISVENQKRYVAEAKFLRAWSYFELVSLWGRVPILTQSATTPDGVPKSSSEDEVYTLIFKDLDEAIPDLPLRSAIATSELGRVPRSAAQALAAKANMFKGDYAKALPYLTAIITSGEHQLVPRYLDNFQEENENNIESLFEIQFSEAFGSNGAWNAQGNDAAECTFRGQEYGPNAWRNLIPSDELVAAFEPGDPRSEYSFFRLGDPFDNGNKILSATDVQGDNSKPSWKKYQTIYKRASENVQSGINLRIIRYADVLLMAAECENEAGNIGTAIGYMNQVRARADVDMPPYPTATYPCSNKAEVLTAVQHERQVELSGEQIRNRDIRRWRRQGKLASEPIKTWDPKYDLLPIPFAEIDNNSAMTNADQNPGH